MSISFKRDVSESLKSCEYVEVSNSKINQKKFSENSKRTEVNLSKIAIAKSSLFVARGRKFVTQGRCSRQPQLRGPKNKKAYITSKLYNCCCYKGDV